MPRLRQAVIAARDLEPVAAGLRERLGLGEPFRDPNVSAFGLQNAVMALGDTFVEVVSPVAEQTAAGRHLDRRGDGGYMVMFQVADVDAARRRAADAGIREVFAIELDDIVDVHFHPRDIGGAIVAVDEPDPAGSWRWGGPAWEGAVPAFGPGAVRGVTIAAESPSGMAARWAEVLGVPCEGDELRLDDGGSVRFVRAEEGRGEGIVGFAVDAPTAALPLELGGVRWTAA